MRLMGILFLALSFLAGITIGSIEIALINVVIFLVMALLFTRFAPERWEPYGTPFLLTGALGIATMWPVFWLPEMDRAQNADGTFTLTGRAPQEHAQ